MLNKSLKSLPPVFLLLALLLAGCQGGDGIPTEVPVIETEGGPTEVPPDILPTEAGGTALGQPFNLLVGESQTIDGTGLTITFEMVERDGRCPSAVDCAEDGPVVVVISAVEEGGQSATDFEMNPDANLAAFIGIPNVVNYGGYEIELTAVDPFPEEPEDLMNLPYSAALVVRKTTTQPESAVTLPVGTTATLDNGDLTITFDRVVSDERCPSEVECETEGPVVIQVTVLEDGQRTSVFTMNPEPGLAGLDGSGATVVSVAAYEIELTAVDPLPQSLDDPMNMAYEATFIVSAKN